MRSLMILTLVSLSFSLFAQTDRRAPNGALLYYGQEFYTAKLTKDSIYKVLSEIHTAQPNGFDLISNQCQSTNSCYRHTSVGYDTARKVLFGELYIQRDSNGTFVQDQYCGKKFYFRTMQDVSNMHTEVNIEHTWPQSKFNGNFDKNMQKSDMHHLYLTDSMANNRRGNNSFGELGNNHDQLNVQNCSASGMAQIGGQMIFTPPPHHKGNVARSLFYFAVRYKLFINPAEEMILRQWHKMDPVDQAEAARHEHIAKYQKVRNPFVDYPQLVERIADF